MTTRLPESDLSDFDGGGDRQDELFTVLSHPHRRFVLQHLDTGEPSTSVGDLTTELVAWEAQRPVSDRTEADRNGIETSLVHVHLPKMAEAGLVEYDEIRQLASLADRTDAAQAHLRTMEAN